MPSNPATKLGVWPVNRETGLRVASAVALAVPAVLSALAGGWIFALWVGLGGCLMVFEWTTIAYGTKGRESLLVTLAGLAAVLVLGSLGEGVLALVVIVGVGGLSALAAWRDGQDPRWAAVGAVYVLLPVLAFVWLRLTALPAAVIILWIFAVVWATDTAALIAGRSIGGPRLAPYLSPQKTWAGLAGAAIGAGLAGLVTSLLVEGSPAVVLTAMSALLAVVGQLGDLTESAFKRRFGVKDSGRFIPGQGGILDRVDGLVFVVLAVAALALIRGGDVLFLGLRS